MHADSQSRSNRPSRRGFLLGTGTGMLAGGALTWLGIKGLDAIQAPTRFTGTSTERKRTTYAMPGRYPGRVIEVRHPDAVYHNHKINARAVSDMLHRGMARLADEDPGDPEACWRKFFSPGDVVGIKVNPVGHKPASSPRHVVGAISNMELIIEIVQGLRRVGVKARDIVLFDRYANEFVATGYEELLRTRPMQGVRWLASSAQYSNEQLDIEGFDQGRRSFSPELARHVVGYDPDVFTTMGYCNPSASARDERRFRSHLSMILTRMVDKVINVPVLKDHRSAGVTLALKNMSHGFNNNVSRSHLSGLPHGFRMPVRTGPNQCNTFIPQAVAQHPIREKVVLHILDGLIGVYEGGPGTWNKTWSTWHHKALFMATDPVAMDHVGWDIIDTKRQQEGWPVVGRMGLINRGPAQEVAREMIPLASPHAMGALMLSASVKNRREGLASESFDLRTPQHIRLAGDLGLGTFSADAIEHRILT